jgi:signal transduction histidine kinase
MEQITLSANQSDDMMIIVIKDSGKACQNNGSTFAPKVKSLSKRLKERKGMGLFAGERFFRKNNGKIWVESEEKKGSSFYFTLPSTNSLVQKILR